MMRYTAFGDCGCGRGDLGAVQVTTPGFRAVATKTTNAALYLDEARAGEQYIVPRKGTVLQVGPAAGKNALQVMVPESVTLYAQDGSGGLVVAASPPAGTVFYTSGGNFFSASSGSPWWLLAVVGAGVAMVKSRRG